MGLRILIAAARGGKTEWAVTQSRKRAVGLLNSPYVLLPSRTQVDDFKQRLANQGGAMGVYLGTFRDLSQEILDLSDANLIVISETAQIKLLQSVLDNLPLNYFKRIKHKPGFAQTLLAIVRELEAGMIDPASFLSAAQKLTQDGRLEELALVYQEYRGLLLKNSWVDPTGLAWMAVDILVDQPDIYPEWDSLIVDGFDDLSPVQLELIISLSQIFPDVTVTITGAGGGTARSLVHKRFNHLRAELENKQQIEFITLDDKKDLSRDGLFGKLEKILFSSNIEEPLAAKDRIKMVAVPDREGEVRAAFRWINKLITEESIHPGQTALIMRNLEPYRKIINKVSREYQLPVFIKGGLPLGENPAVAAILSLLSLASSGRNGLVWQDVISLWQSPYFDWGVLSLENYQENNRHLNLREAKQLSDIARWGSVIQGFEQWKEAFQKLSDIPAGDEKSSLQISVPGHIPTGENAKTLWRKFESFVEFITPPEDGLVVEDYLLWVENLLGDLNIEEDRIKGLNLFQMAIDGGSDLFQRDSQAIKKLSGLFREYIWSNLMFSFGPTTFNDVLVDLKSEIKRQSYQRAQDNEDLIICADCTEVRGVSYNAVALIGLAEGEFPGSIKEDPFLRNEDRTILKDKHGFQLRSSTESAEAEFFYEAVTRTSDWLLITRPRIADNGAPWQPSPYWEEILKTTDITPEMRTSRNVPSLENAGSRSELFEVIAAAGRENRIRLLREASTEYPDYYNQVLIAQKVIFARTGRSEKFDLRYDGRLEHLSKDLQVRYPEEHIWSPSRLENYQTCPLNFFVNNLLGLKKPEPPQEGLDARQLGNIYHHIMEDLYLDVGSDYDIQGLLALVPGISRKVFDEAPSREGFRETAWWHHTQREILTNIKHSLIVLEGMDSSFRFFRAEQKFGIRNDSAPQLDIDVEGKGTYHLRGLIDRVDINDQGNLRIIDYKTSSPFGFDNQAVREGKKLQLPLYALAAQEGLQLGNVQEGFYFHVRSAQPSIFKMSAFWNDGERGSQVAIKNAIIKGWQAVSSIQAGVFSPHPPGNGCPAYCPAVDFCWHYQRKNW
jgi:ATP-dependent helicase/DNAse subunit B